MYVLKWEPNIFTVQGTSENSKDEVALQEAGNTDGKWAACQEPKVLPYVSLRHMRRWDTEWIVDT